MCWVFWGGFVRSRVEEGECEIARMSVGLAVLLERARKNCRTAVEDRALGKGGGGGRCVGRLFF